jgi:hypothetical protein
MIPALVTIELPIATVSEANRASHEHWRERAKRAKAQSEAVVMHMLAQRAAWDHLRLPLVVVLVRHSSGTLDTDNLAASLKHVQDGVTDALGLYLPKGEGPRPHNQRAPGFAKPKTVHYDDRHRLAWHYAQRKCAKGHERVDVRFYQPGSVSQWLLSKLTETGPSEIEAWAITHAVELDALLVREVG